MTKTSEGFEGFKRDMRHDPETLEDDVVRARADVERTVEALMDRFSPGQLLDGAIRSIRDNGGVFGRNLASQIRNNPVPTLLAGIGLTWLMAASDRPPRHAGQDTGTSAGDGASRAAASLRGAAGSAAARTKTAAQKARAGAQGVADAARDGAQGTRRASHTGARGLREGYGYVRDGYRHLSREQPLVLGALAVTAGAAIGALLPRTAAEDRTIGDESDKATARLKEAGRRRAEEMQGAAAQAAEAAKDAVVGADRGKEQKAPEATTGGMPSGS